MEKKDIILDMCNTYRPNYVLLPQKESDVIHNTMTEFFEKCIEKYLNFDEPDPTWEPWSPPLWTEEKKEELKKVLEEIFPKLKENSNQYVPITPVKHTEYGWGKCHICKGEYKNMTHYCCNNPKCPSRVTCVSTTLGN